MDEKLKGSLKAPTGVAAYRAREESSPPELPLSEQVAQLRLDLKSVVAETLAQLRPPEANALTLNEFWERWIREYAKANRQKPRGIESKESDLKLHWVPRLGDRPLNLITDEDIQQFKADAEEAELHPKTVNNKLSTLNKLLKCAVDWKKTTGLLRMPVSIKMLPIVISDADFYDFARWDYLVSFAEAISPEVLCVVLLGGDAGFRRGEIIGLEWPDWSHGQLHVQRSESRGYITLPKSGKGRRVATTDKLESALQAMKALGRPGQRVITTPEGKPLSEQAVRTLFAHAQKAASYELTGLHILRHTFCSHLAMRGAPARAIQALAGHASLRTTERYMHLSPTVGDAAIGLLDSRRAGRDSAAPAVNSMTLPGFEPGMKSTRSEHRKSSKARKFRKAESRQTDALVVWRAELDDSRGGGH